MKNLKAKQSAKGVKELSAEETEQVTGGFWDMNDPVSRRRYDPLQELEKTLGINEGPGQEPPFSR